MKEIYERKEVIGGIPVYRIGHTGKKRVHPVFLYHGWSSSALQQRTRGMILAWEGYEVWMPEAVHHGIRGTADYYAPASYDIFWKTIFQNIKEFPLLSAEARKRGLDSPWVMGHSMGGLTVLGMGAHFSAAYQRNHLHERVGKLDINPFIPAGPVWHGGFPLMAYV